MQFFYILYTYMKQNHIMPFVTLGSSGPPNSEPCTLTQAVETEGTVVKKEADVACPRRHAAEGVSTA